MPRYEYKVIPAPRRGKRTRGAKGTEARFAFALQEVMNEQGSDGWEYLRADTLPCEERRGLTGWATVYQNMLVFRRAQDQAADAATTQSAPSQSAPLPLEKAHAETAQQPRAPKAPGKQVPPTIENVVSNARGETPALGGVNRGEKAANAGAKTEIRADGPKGGKVGKSGDGDQTDTATG